MSRTRTLTAAVLFLFGTTFLWLMPSFLGAGDDVAKATRSAGIPRTSTKVSQLDTTGRLRACLMAWLMEVVGPGL
jgi:hypothetical protein